MPVAGNAVVGGLLAAAANTHFSAATAEALLPNEDDELDLFGGALQIKGSALESVRSEGTFNGNTPCCGKDKAGPKNSTKNSHYRANNTNHNAADRTSYVRSTCMTASDRLGLAEAGRLTLGYRYDQHIAPERSRRPLRASAGGARSS